MGVLIREVSALYAAFSNNQPSLHEELPIQYADYAVWQREQLQGEALEQQLAYWREQLTDAPQVLELPTDRVRPAVQNYRGAAESFTLSRELTEQLMQLSREQNVTLFMTLLSAFQTLLHRYSNQQDILVGTPIANRTRRETESLIGFFVNTLVLRNRFTSELTFRELLEQTREVTLGAYAHQDIPFERIVEELQPERSLSHAPLFQVWFVLDDIQMEPLKLPDLTLLQIDADSGTTQFDLVLSMYEFEQQIGGALRYSTDLFDRETIVEMTESFQRLLAEITAHPDHCLLDIPLHQNEQSSSPDATSERQTFEQAEDQFVL
jgi:non-ribosomal peptide synthetase component F